MRCCRIDQAMMLYSPVGIPPEVSSLADEVDGPGARFHTSTHRKTSSNFPKSLLFG